MSTNYSTIQANLAGNLELLDTAIRHTSHNEVIDQATFRVILNRRIELINNLDAVALSGNDEKTGVSLKHKKRSPKVMLSLHDLGNCEEGDYDFLYVGCIVSEKRAAKLIAKIGKTPNTYFSRDCSCGGHSCIIEISGKSVLKSIKLRSVTENETETLIKFGYAEYKNDCEWYQEFIATFE